MTLKPLLSVVLNHQSSELPDTLIKQTVAHPRISLSVGVMVYIKNSP